MQSKFENQISSQKLGSKNFCRICSSRHFRSKKSKSSLPPLSLKSSTMAVSSADKAELLCREFAKNSAVVDGDQSFPTFPQRTASTLLPLFISAKQVQRIINSLGTSKSSGPDGIPTVVLKMCAPELSPILAKLYRKCLSVGEFPSSTVRLVFRLSARCSNLQSIHICWITLRLTSFILTLSLDLDIHVPLQIYWHT